MTAPLTGAALARAYNALRERADHHNDGSCMSCYDWCSTCAEIRRDLAALPPLPVVETPEVGSELKGVWSNKYDSQEITVHTVRVWAKTGEVEAVSQDGSTLRMTIGELQNEYDYEPAPEAGE